MGNEISGRKFSTIWKWVVTRYKANIKERSVSEADQKQWGTEPAAILSCTIMYYHVLDVRVYRYSRQGKIPFVFSFSSAELFICTVMQLCVCKISKSSVHKTGFFSARLAFL